MIPPLIAIHLARKPLEGTVAANALTHGTGSLNIDESRLGGGSTERPQNEQDNGGSMRDGTWQGGTTGSTKGRWPANLILQHLEGCKQVGTKRVKGIQGGGAKSHGFSHSGVYGSGKGTRSDGSPLSGNYADADGTETVDAWECVEGCPVADLDEQSGERRSAGHFPTTFESPRSGNPTSFQEKQGPLYDDKGGASRYFKQVGGNKP